MALITIGSASDRGKRETNEDSLLAVTAQDAPARAGEPDSAMNGSALLVLADGMGGRAHGGMASQAAVKAVYRELAHVLALRADIDGPYLEHALRGAFRVANARVQELGAGTPGANGMGTTCTVVMVTRGLIALAHVGDSRAYLLPEDGAGDIQLLTEDHSVVAGEVRAGRLTEEQARRSRFRNVITRAVGVENDVVPDVLVRAAPLGLVSELVVSSDGLHGVLDAAEIGRILRRFPGAPQEAANALVDAAKTAGASDNISAIVARIDATRDVEAVRTEVSSSAQTPRARWARRRWRAGLLGNAAAFLAGIALTAILVWLTIPGEGNWPTHPFVRLAPAPAPADLARVSYGNPTAVLAARISPSVLWRVGDDLMVVNAANKQILTVNPQTGHVASTAPDAAGLANIPPRTQYWAVDAQGNLYRSDPVPPLVRKYAPNGQFLRTIAQGVLTKPAALAVGPDGSVYVIDAGVLKRIPAVAGTVPAPPSSNTTATAASAEGAIPPHG